MYSRYFQAHNSSFINNNNIIKNDMYIDITICIYIYYVQAN